MKTLSRILQSIACLWLAAGLSLPAFGGVIINSYRFATGSGNDPYFANVSLLLHMQGADGSTTFTDSSANAFTVTAGGGAVISITQYKWGTASGLFDGSGDYLSVPANAAFDFSTSAFTIEWWYRPAAVSGLQYFFDIGSNGTFLRCDNGSTVLAWATGAEVLSGSISPALSNGTWYHMAFVRSGNTFTLYVDGVSKVTGSNSRASGSSASGLRIGSWGSGGYELNGRLQDFRITKAVARYTSAFSPPAAQFPDS